MYGVISLLNSQAQKATRAACAARVPMFTSDATSKYGGDGAIRKCGGDRASRRYRSVAAERRPHGPNVQRMQELQRSQRPKRPEPSQPPPRQRIGFSSLGFRPLSLSQLRCDCSLTCHSLSPVAGNKFLFLNFSQHAGFHLPNKPLTKPPHPCLAAAAFPDRSTAITRAAVMSPASCPTTSTVPPPSF